jgi:hypothetical protein
MKTTLSKSDIRIIKDLIEDEKNQLCQTNEKWAEKRWCRLDDIMDKLTELIK